MRRTTEPLAEHTWLKIGGPAEIAIPESEAELVDLLRECHETGRAYRLLGNGSNLLVNDDGVDELVIKTTEAATTLEIEGNRVVAGASVMIPQFVTACIDADLGGYEFLYSVPGTIGGAIYMNAGRGASYGKTIADHLESVTVFAEGERRTLTVDELDLSHRHTVFHDNEDWVVLSATFDMPDQPREEGRRLAKERMAKVEERERTRPNAGSVFKSGARLPLHKVPPNGLSVGDARFVATNRICHDGAATYRDVRRLVTLATWLHRLVPPFKAPDLEWIVWD